MGILDAPLSKANVLRLAGWPTYPNSGPMICGLLGDSRLYASHITDGGVAGTTYPAQEVPVNRDDLGTNGVAHHLQCISGGSVLVPRAANFSISQQKSWDIEARADAAITGMTSAGATACILLCGTNDRGAANVTHVQTILNIQSIVSKIIAANLLAIVIAELPRGDSVETLQRLNSTLLSEHMMVRRAILDMHNGRNVIAVDCWPTVADQSVKTGDALLGYTVDGLHNNAKMSRRIATAIWTQISPLVRPYSWAPAGPCDEWSTSNTTGAITLNPCVTGATGTLGSGMTGQIADFWVGGTVSAGIICTASKSTDPYGRSIQTFTISGTSTTTTAFDLMRRDSSIGNYGLVIGSRVRAVACLDINISSGLYEIDVYAASGTKSVRAGSSEAAYTVSTMPADISDRDVYVSEVLTIPTGATTVRMGIRLFPQTATVSVIVSVRWLKLVYA